MIINFKGELVNWDKQTHRAICHNCGCEFRNYIETGKLGCSVCYDVFHDQIKEQVSRWN